MLNKTLTRSIALVLIFLLLLPCVLVFASAQEESTVYIGDNFESYNPTNGNVTDKHITADFSGSNNYAIIKDGALSGNRSALINGHIDWRWWGLNITAEALTIAYKIHVLPSDSLELTTCMAVSSDASTNSEGLGGALTVIRGNGTELGVYNRNGDLITALEYNKTYSVKMDVTAASDTFTMEIDGKTYGDLPYASAVYAINAFRFNATDGASFYFDDFTVYSTSRTFPQKYSAQKPGQMEKLDYPTYYESEGITLWLNADGTEAGKGALKLDMPVKETNNTLYLPFDEVKKQIKAVAASKHEPECEPDPITWGGVNYITIQQAAELINGRVWWDEAQEMVVISDENRKNDGILRNVGGRFYMNGQPYYEISFNKFDLAAQILINYFPDRYRDFNIGEDQRANAERALKELSDNGFTTIRFFSYVDSYAMINDPVESEKYWTGLDELFDLCDKYNIKVVPSLCCGTGYMTACQYVEGVGYVSIGEDRIDLITNPESQSREFQKKYLETYINRYKDRKTILMWEINNEMNLEIDVGPSIGTVTYSAYQLRDFYAWCTDIINACDPVHLVTSGDSVQRNSNYHLLTGTMAGQDVNNWDVDTYADRLYMNYLLHGQGGLDVTSVHAYGESTEVLHIAKSRLRTTANRLSLTVMEDEARALGQPLYVGEAGINTAIANANTDYETIQKMLDGFVALGLQLVHWWTYDTCRLPSFGDDTAWNMNMTEFPESVALLKNANEALKAKWLVNRADEEVTITDTGDNTVTDDTDSGSANPETAPVTDPEGTSDSNQTSAPSQNEGCASALSVSALLVFLTATVAACAVIKKKGSV